MPTFAQFGTSEVSKSALVSQFVSTYEASGRKTASGSELRQLQEELERMVARASARVQQLEHSQAQVMRSRAGEGGGNERGSSKRDRDGFRLSDGSLSQVLAGGTVEAKAVSISAADSAAVGSSADSKAASKRAKSSSSLASQRVGGSDSEQSVNTSSKVGGDGKYFQAGGGGGGGEQSAMAGQAKARQHSTGTPVQEDFSRVKVTNQVQIQTFWASLEPYFRSITDEDIGFLESSTDSQEAYTVPRLGKFYARAWAEEEVTHFPDHMSNNKTRYTAKHLLSLDRSSGSQAAATAAAAAAAAAEGRSFSGRELVDSDLTFNSVRLAPLTERIISALVAERLVVVGGGEDGNGDSGGHMAKHQEFAEFGEGSDSSDGEFVEARHLSSSGEAITLEERLKRELRYIGILDESDVDWDEREDDEVCATMRMLQRQLREQTRINSQRKQRLLAIAKEHVGYQEYTQVIDELDKQVEQSYLKRHRLTKSRKRKSAAVKSTVGLSDNALNAMDRRQRVIQAIGHLFPAEKFGVATGSVYSGIADNAEIVMK